MKRLLTLIFIALFATNAFAKPSVVWEISEGLDKPESVYYHAYEDMLFVSQIVGGGTEKDGKGWISKVSLAGKMINEKWATGLNAPKGLRAINGVLWVSDIDRLVGFNLKDGKQVEAVTVPDAKFLNDVATCLDGTVFVSDMGTSKIWRYRDGKLQVFAEGDQTEKPNGLLVSGTRLLVGGWNSAPKTGGNLIAIDMRTREKTKITKEPLGNLDGVELDGRGNYTVTDWVAGTVYRIDAEGKVETLLQLPKGTADHAYIQDHGLLILPRMIENKLTAYQVHKPEPMNWLLNGNDLSGWVTTGNWKAKKDGVYSLTPRPGERGWKRYGAYLSTEKKYGDFELHVEYKIPPKGNSGVYVRIADLKDPVGKGIEVQVLDSFDAKKKLGHHDHGGIIRTAGPTKNMSNPASTWNKMVVICRKHHMVVILNGEKIQDLQLNETPMKDRPLVGYINIQDHGLPMEVRNIGIRELN